MKKEEKSLVVEALADKLNVNNNFYFADISELNAEDTSALRRLCYKREVTLTVVKNTLLKKAMEQTDKDLEALYDTLKGPTSIMFAKSGNAPAKLIKEFRKKSSKPLLKGAYIEEMTYVGDNQLDFLVALKSKNELIADVIGLLQSPVTNVMSALQSGRNILSGVVKTLSERSE
ncbi:MAG: 50S ribosomal protein L10 [Bacteroidales bacterium]|nr:50S ribosomal protein L10 [Bacteroidales bacterium]